VPIMEQSDAFDVLRTFRDCLYECFDRRADALFELTDSILTAGVVPSPVHLSLEAVHRRGWGSLYAALSRGRIDTEALRALLSRHPLAGDQPPIYAVDVSVWSRCDAEASPERGYYYHPSRHSAGQPIVAGWAYQWIVQLGFSRESWVAPVDVLRVRPTENPNEVAAEQIKRLLDRAPGQCGASPLFVFDAGYDPVQLQTGMEGWNAQILVRLRAGRCFYADPAGPPARTGRPRRHGPKMDTGNSQTWPEPSEEHRCEDPSYGLVYVRTWAGLHPKTHNHPTRGTRRPRPIARGTLVLVEVSRLPRPTREPRRLWLWWSGPGRPELDLLWRAYVRRFDLEHTFRFLKQTLGWTTPRVRHPEQADLWTWVVLAAFTQLRLARPCVADRRLPWERRYAHGRLTPLRVRRSVLALLLELGTPAKPPKPCGRSPGRPKGRLSGPAKRYPAIKKAA
jgi:hypothetical protein